jgi:nucleotide-binding universal stress UspA family protein
MFPPRTVLAAVDFSEASRVALTFAARFSRHVGAELHVLHAVEPLLAAAASAGGADLVRETREELNAFMGSARPADDWAPLHHVVAGPGVDVICEISARENADLIVIGARGMSGLERHMFGSTTEGVLRNADRSICVVPATWRPARLHTSDLTGMGPIVAAVDTSMPAIAAARAASGLAGAVASSVEAVHIVPALPVIARWSVHADEAMRQQVANARQELNALLPCVRAEVPLRLSVECGVVADGLAAAVERAGHHSILVLGRRTRVDRGTAPGSTAYRVLTMVDVPVLVYLPDA